MNSKRAEEYLKTIYILKNRKEKISVTNIAKEMNVSKPGVTKQLNILKENGMISYEAYGDIILTNKGIVTAKKILGAYDIVYLLMKDVFKLNDEKAKVEANKVKNVLEEDTLNLIAKYVYNELGLDVRECNFNISSEKCIECFHTKKQGKGSDIK